MAGLERLLDIKMGTDMTDVSASNGSLEHEAPKLRLVVGFSRTVQPAPFESIKAEVQLEETWVGTTDPNDLAMTMASHYQVVKVAVFEQLGIEYRQDEVTGMIMEVFPGTQSVSHGVKSAKELTEQPDGSWQADNEPPYDDEPEPEPERQQSRPAPRRREQPAPARKAASRPAQGHQGGNRGRALKPHKMSKEDLWDHLWNNPERWYDNRASKTSERAPDFRSRDYHGKNPEYPEGLWLSDSPIEEDDLDTLTFA